MVKCLECKLNIEVVSCCIKTTVKFSNKSNKLLIVGADDINLILFEKVVYLTLQALAANKASLSEMDVKLAKEIELKLEVERKRECDKEMMRELGDEINKRKEELRRTITEQIGNFVIY